MDEKITADWVRSKTSEKHLIKRVEDELKSCQLAIMESIENDMTYCDVFIKAHNKTLIELISRGVTVKENVGDIPINVESIRISW